METVFDFNSFESLKDASEGERNSFFQGRG